MSRRTLTSNERSFQKNPRSFIKENAIVPLEIEITDSNGTVDIVTIDPKLDQNLEADLPSGGSVTVRPIRGNEQIP